MKCCICCFNDDSLKDYIADHGNLNKCDFCDAKPCECIETDELLSLFKNFMELYDSDEFSFRYKGTNNENGTWKKDYSRSDYSDLLTLIQDDWNLFSDTLSEVQSRKLLFYIVDPLVYGKKFVMQNLIDPIWIRWVDKYGGIFGKKDWKIFKDFLQHKYRFIIQENSRKYGFNPEDLLDNLILNPYFHSYIYARGTALYRARINQDSQTKPYKKGEMGIPAKTIITNNRANPAGINYLYCCDNKETAMAEVRAWKGSRVSIASIAMDYNLKVLDFTKTFDFSPFAVDANSRLIELIESKNMIEAIASDLSKPIHPDAAVIDYIPTQYICELAKLFSEPNESLSEIDGIKFKSSVGAGNNIVLFNMNKVKIRSVSTYTVSSIVYEIKKI